MRTAIQKRGERVGGGHLRGKQPILLKCTHDFKPKKMDWHIRFRHVMSVKYNLAMQNVKCKQSEYDITESKITSKSKQRKIM